MTQEEFVARVEEKFPNKFDFSKCKYINAQSNVILICKDCGKENIKKAYAFYNQKYGCSKCAKDHQNDWKKFSTEELIEKFKKVHKDKYRYPKKIEYTNMETDKIKIWCKKCKKYFYQSIKNHKEGTNCPICAGKERGINQTYSEEDVIKRIKEVHGDKYLFDNFNFTRMNEKSELICPIHGSFWIRPSDVITSGQGCRLCGINSRARKNTKNTNQFIKEAKKVHKNKYDYSKSNYINCDTPITIVCPKHGAFEMIPYSHIKGQGCSYCNELHSFEWITEKVLKDLNLNFKRQIKFDKCRNKLPLPFDFGIYKTKNKKELLFLIECQGNQHFIVTDFFGGKESFDYRKNNDNIKKRFCKNNNYILIEILYPSSRHVEGKYEEIKKQLKEKIDGITEVS